MGEKYRLIGQICH